MREIKLVIIKNKIMDITNMGWNPTKCNKTVVAFIGKRKLKHSDFYFDKEGNLYTFEDLVDKYKLPVFDKKLWNIIKKDYQAVWVQADRIFTRSSKFLKQYLKEQNNERENNN